MLEPEKNPNPRLMADPPALVRYFIRWAVDPVINPKKVKAKRDKVEAARIKAGAPHVVEYFHQLDDPYSCLAAQTLAALADRYDIKLVPHLIRATGGKSQPEAAKLARWARRDAELIAPYLGLEFPSSAPLLPPQDVLRAGLRVLGGLTGTALLQALPVVSKAVWLREIPKSAAEVSDAKVSTLLDAGSTRLAELKHYSGAMFYYGGEWYWGVDRLFHLERRLRDLDACKTPDLPLICPRPAIDVAGVDASHLDLDFYPSLNSPYSAIIYDKTVEEAKACGVRFHLKHVLPMVMRGLPVPSDKGKYINFDTKREAVDLGVAFGPIMFPVGRPVREIYSLMPWARENGRDTELLSAALRLAWGMGVGLHRRAGIRAAVEMAGLSWNDAKQHLGSDTWKPIVEAHQDEMVDVLDLWGVPSYRLRGGGTEDLSVWGQDRLWLVAAEIKKRAASQPAGQMSARRTG